MGGLLRSCTLLANRARSGLSSWRRLAPGRVESRFEARAMYGLRHRRVVAAPTIRHDLVATPGNNPLPATARRLRLGPRAAAGTAQARRRRDHRASLRGRNA